MIVRALFIALSCAWASAIAPLTAGGEDSDCALYLTGPGRSSAYDYSINLLKGNFGYDGQHTCITYDAINQAYLEARNRILVARPKGDWKPEDYASVGELVLDISINLARRYGLTYEEIEKGLPLIDTSRTLIREVCPPVFSHVECRAGKYRRFDGLCNNLKHPTWGSTNSPFQRLIGPLFSDGINAPRISHTGQNLPLSRVVSRTMHPDHGFHDHAGTVMVIAWGQFMDHDYTLTGTPLDPLNRNDPEECCKRPSHLKHPYCNEIRIPEDDYFYRLFGVKCIDFVRAFPSPRPGCRLGSRTPFNTLTGVIDGNTVYGITEKFSRKLRTGYGGLLRMNPVFEEYGLKDLLPLKLDIPDEGCTRPNKNMYCFEAGEIRVNEQLVLTVMHTLMAREHNRIAKALAEVNPHWDDEILFQESRRINIAEIQHITYNEFLPILLGKDVMEKFGLVLEKDGYWDGYDPEVNPDVIDSFAAAAFRFGHSLLPTAVERWSKAHKFIASKRLSDLIRRPYDLYRAGVLDEYVMGLMNQVAQAMDDSITQEVTNHLFKKVGARFGMDLVSFNMQRGREFGLPGYMEFRKFCGLPGAESFQELFGSMTNDTVRKYETIFEHPIDVDLWSGGVSERPLPGSMLGPTFACIIATQFSYSRRGDRFWFELANQPSSFTPEQLVEIRKARLARVICDNTDIIDTVQLYPMVLPDHELNPRVACRSGILPSMDFSKWAEPVPFHGTAKQFNTNATATAFNSTLENEETKYNCDDHNTTQQNTNCNCNETSNIEVQKTENIMQSPLESNCTENESEIVLNSETKSQTNKTKTKNELPDGNTLLKYVYKNTDKVKEPAKSLGIARNSLKRRKRMINGLNQNELIAATSIRQPALIVNYETSHDLKNTEITLPARLTDKTIQPTNLADFNIETLHDSKINSNEDFLKTNINLNPKPLPQIYRSSQDHSLRGNGRFNSPYLNNNKEEQSDKNEENKYSSNKKHINSEPDETHEENDDDEDEDDEDDDEDEDDEDDGSYNESYENNKYKTLPESSGHAENHRDRQIHTDLVKNKELADSAETKPKYNPHEESRESNEKDSGEIKKINRSYDELEPKHLPFKDVDVSNASEQSGESAELNKDPNNQGNAEPNINSNNNKTPLQEVDLDDFSYERIQLNKKGEVEVLKGSVENIENDHSKQNSSSKPTVKIGKYDESRSAEDISSSVETSSENNGQVKINDGEIKPVVEINPESESIELSEENIKAPLKSSLNSNDESLESVLGINKDISDKIVSNTEHKNDEEAKQQFERIPLDYKHDDKEKQKGDEQLEVIEKPANNEGTLDTVSPPENYDEHLNIKFDELAIKLPEINLPEDILAYAHPVYDYRKRKDEEKEKLNPYKENQYSEEKQAQKEDDTDYPSYYGYYGEQDKKEDYKKKTPEDSAENGDGDDDDLYEKFVRERFGKRGSFEKRAENLEDAKGKQYYNPQLYDTIQNILKKTEDIEKTAQESKDPKAGYMWTLEYGQNA